MGFKVKNGQVIVFDNTTSTPNNTIDSQMNPVDGDVLTFDNITGEWTNKPASTPGAIDDKKLKVTGSDTTAEFLSDKLLAGGDVGLEIVNPGANEKIRIIAPVSAPVVPPDVKVKITSADVTTGYLLEKVEQGSNVIIQKITDSFGTEKLRISAIGDGGGSPVTNSDELVSMYGGDPAGYLSDQIDGSSIVVNGSNKLSVPFQSHTHTHSDISDWTTTFTNDYWANTKTVVKAGTFVTLDFNDTTKELTINANPTIADIYVKAHSTDPYAAGYLKDKVYVNQLDVNTSGIGVGQDKLIIVPGGHGHPIPYHSLLLPGGAFLPTYTDTLIGEFLGTYNKFQYLRYVVPSGSPAYSDAATWNIPIISHTTSLGTSMDVEIFFVAETDGNTEYTQFRCDAKAIKVGSLLDGNSEIHLDGYGETSPIQITTYPTQNTYLRKATCTVTNFSTAFATGDNLIFGLKRINPISEVPYSSNIRVLYITLKYLYEAK